MFFDELKRKDWEIAMVNGESRTLERLGEATPRVLRRSEWTTHEHWFKGNVEGRTLGTDATLLFYATDQAGEGPRWHVHPYDEIFIIRSGAALFTIGSEKIHAEAGDILVGPANVPHKYHNLGPGLLATTDIHLSDRWVQTNLDDPELLGS